MSKWKSHLLDCFEKSKACIPRHLRSAYWTASSHRRPSASGEKRILSNAMRYIATWLVAALTRFFFVCVHQSYTTHIHTHAHAHRTLAKQSLLFFSFFSNNNFIIFSRCSNFFSFFFFVFEINFPQIIGIWKSIIIYFLLRNGKKLIRIILYTIFNFFFRGEGGL